MATKLLLRLRKRSRNPNRISMHNFKKRRLSQRRKRDWRGRPKRKPRQKRRPRQKHID